MCITMSQKIPKVVLAETDDDIAVLLLGSFKMSGFAAWRAASAEARLSKIRELGGGLEAVVICGQLASDRGVMLIINIKRINPKIKILVIAERSEEENKTRVLDYGADEFVLKPVSIESIITKINALLVEEAVATSSTAATRR